MPLHLLIYLSVVCFLTYSFRTRRFMSRPVRWASVWLFTLCAGWPVYASCYCAVTSGRLDQANLVEPRAWSFLQRSSSSSCGSSMCYYRLSRRITTSRDSRPRCCTLYFLIGFVIVTKKKVPRKKSSIALYILLGALHWIFKFLKMILLRCAN